MIAESVGKTEEVLELGENISLEELKARQVQKHNIADPESIQLAVNQDLNTEVELKDDDEVAFLPPFAGG
ncbi:MoaD/ThiS family protein [Christiangramia sp.]|uniref:MoaD/ThiS family protein n=1 Tax=Christiangramia sp. TaxID=1931228 RepID=UPI00260EBFC1|nr:MoaD/ThiS family protein [Christiangramia sp.]